MIKVLCTKKLAEMLPQMPAICMETIPALDKWCVNLTIIHRKNVVVAMNADTRFGFILWGVKKAQFANLPELISMGIRTTLEDYGVREEIINDYLAEDPELYIGADRKDIGRLNRLTIDVSNMLFNHQPDDFIPIKLARIINDMPVDVVRKDCFFPLDRMLECLQARYDMKPICRPAFELTATMDLEIFETRRTLMIPENYTFADLHRALQAVFDWKDYHMYEFIIGQERISCEDDEDKPLLATNTILSKYLKTGDEFLYLYDFGDGWEVSIHVDSINPDFDQPQPICTVCDGAAPPEDVGGVPGFIEFWGAYNDPKHPDHENVKEWVGYLWHPEPNMNWINHMLSR